MYDPQLSKQQHKQAKKIHTEGKYKYEESIKVILYYINELIHQREWTYNKSCVKKMKKSWLVL